MSVLSPRHDQHDENDEDVSLFGSPPPSPGRSPSPALALPLRSNNNNASGPTSQEASALSNLNVGTIALPGSQPSSELFVDPLAPSLASLPTPTSLVNNAHRRTASQSTTASGAPSSRTRQASSSSTAKPPRVKKRKVTRTSTEPRRQVQIPLPDPSGPVPPHFLRSQTGLLGLAGLVGGVNPAQLKLRGQTPTNPIVVEDEEVSKAPAVTKAPPKKSRLVPGLSKEMQVLLKAAKPSEIPVPTKQEILAVLVKEKDLTPIIQGLIKLGMDAQGRVAPSAPSAPSPTKEESSATDGQPPAKKRKVSIVPAGADDWDVPYPFPEGQGPTSYRSSWKTERGKQLIDQLVELTKMASKKAAVQKFLKVKGIQLSTQGNAQSSSGEVEIVNGYYKSMGQPPPPLEPPPAEERVNKYYKPITATYGLSVQRPPFPVASSSRQSRPAAPSTPQPPPRASCASNKQSGAAVAADASSDLAAPVSTSANASLPASKEASPAVPEPASQEVQDFISSLLGVTNEQRTGKPSTEPSQDDSEPFFGFNNDLFMQEDIFANWQPTFSTPSDPSGFPSSSATPITSTPDLDLSSFADFAFLSSHFGEPSMGVNPVPTEASADTSNIDPELLGMSSTMTRNLLDDVFPLPEDFGVASPNSSISPFTGGPATPASADWDMTLPDVFAPQASTNMQDALALPDFANMNVDSGMDLQQQQSEQDGGLGGWAALVSLGKFGKVDGADMGVLGGGGGGIPASGDDVGQQGDLTLASVGDGLVQGVTPQLGIETQSAPPLVEQAGETQELLQGTSALPAEVPQELSNPDAPATSTIISQPPPQRCDPQPSLQPSSSEAAGHLPTQPAPSSRAPAPTKSKLASQKEETIKRIKDRKAELEAELQKVKLQLWETTIEQGALGHVVQYYQEREKENEHQHQRQTQPRGEQEHTDSHTETLIPVQVLSTIENAPPLS